MISTQNYNDLKRNTIIIGISNLGRTLSSHQT